MGRMEVVVVGEIGNLIETVGLEGWAIGGRLSVGGMGNGMEVVEWEWWNLQASHGDCVSLLGAAVYPVWPCLWDQLRDRVAAHEVYTRHPSQIHHHVQQRNQPHAQAPSPSFPAAASPPGSPSDHPKDKVPEPVLNQLFLEITPHQELYFLTQMITFCLRPSSLAFLNATTRIDAVLGQCAAVNSCLLGDFTSPSNQAGPS